MMRDLKIGRRDFLAVAGAASLLTVVTGCREPILAQKSETGVLDALRKNALTSQEDNWWGARHVLNTVTSKATIATAADKGERIIISGTVFANDGKTTEPNT